MPQLLTESSSAPVKSGNNWRAVLITPGKGSSGVYTEEMLKEYGPEAFKKGTHSYVDHPRDESDIRSPKNLIGVLAEDARYEDGIGLVAELSIMPHWKEFVEAVAPHTGLSIYAMGEGNYNDAGEVVVENLVPHTQNSVDLVSYPGRAGSKLADKLYEQAISMLDEPDEISPTEESVEEENGTAAPTVAETVTNMKEGNSDMELKELSDQLAELPNLVAAAVAEALAPAVETEEKEEVDVAAVAEAMVEADLPQVSRKAVYESLRAGADLTEAIENQKAFVESVKSHFKEEAAASSKNEETVIVNTQEKAASLSEILNVKVGA